MKKSLYTALASLRNELQSNINEPRHEKTNIVVSEQVKFCCFVVFYVSSFPPGVYVGTLKFNCIDFWSL